MMIISLFLTLIFLITGLICLNRKPGTSPRLFRFAFILLPLLMLFVNMIAYNIEQQRLHEFYREHPDACGMPALGGIIVLKLLPLSVVLFVGILNFIKFLFNSMNNAKEDI